jgi:hypothetical protein
MEPIYKMVDGERVEMSEAEAVAIRAEWQASAVAPEPVPQSVTPRQARLALLAAGHLAAVNAAVAAAGPQAQIDWDYALEIRRDNALIASMAASLGLTDAQIDDLFRAAAVL